MADRARLQTRLADERDLDALARVYCEGIEDRTATFETEPRTAEDVRPWLSPPYLALVAEIGSEVVGFAVASPYSGRSCYRGVFELSIYVDRARRGAGAGRALGDAIARAAEARGAWKLVGKVFPENAASRRLLRALGFAEVGVHRRHARLDGRWRDVVVVEKLLAEAADTTLSG